MVTVGEEVLIEGFGFFPGDVLVEYSVDATPLSSVTVTADATGAFTTTITPAAGEEGLWTVDASDSSKGQCTDTTSFEVVGVPATPTPTPTPPPTPTPVPRRLSCPTWRQHRRRRCSRSGPWARRSWGWRPSPCGRRSGGAVPDLVARDVRTPG